jgi:hypothetical protein
MTKVLYIAGESRSGSTLLEMTLGQVPGIWAAGELRYLWSRGLAEDQLCGCGSAFHDCDVWRQVISRAFGDSMLADGAQVQQINALQAKVDQPRSVFRNAFFSPRRYTGAFREARLAYVKMLGRLYRAIDETAREASAATPWIIDSSKAPSHGLLACEVPDIQVHVVHIVRDCRAVAFSMQRKKARPEITDRQVFMPTYPAWRTAVRWTLINRVCDRFNGRGAQRNGQSRAKQPAGYTFVRYEDFIRDPRTTVQMILDDLAAHDEQDDTHDARAGDAGSVQPALDFIDGATVRLASNHTVAGNPIRFKTGEVKLVEDDQWRRELPANTRWMLRAVAGGMLRRYGYT